MVTATRPGGPRRSPAAGTGRVSIHAFSKADSVQGQGVGSAYLEQVALITAELGDEFDVVDRARRAGHVNHFHSINPEFLARVPMIRRRGRTVGHVHFIPETVHDSITLPRPARAVFDAYMLRFYRSMDQLVTVNPWFIRKLAEDYGFDAERIAFIPNFVSEQDFRPLTDPEGAAQVAALREELGLDPSRPVVLCAGQLQVRKGFFDFLDVARAMPDVQFLWAGGFSFGRITAGHSRIREAAEDLPANVRLLGMVPRERMNLHVNLADCFFLPSFEELFPMTILEAMAAHTPVVVRELVYYEGVLADYARRVEAESGQIAPFVEALEGVLAPGPVREQARDAARRGAAAYDRASVARQWREFYRGVAAG
ncbi:glycosyltransferase family 4 protein [Brachybacterium phenoliresistens]|uniref:glycosyltransferase family 4 protein n=1 Tax=Brachybacterium phenoliresistens TaxID=396014 RepID=UPI0031D1FE12